jgi:hypothetical protein
MTAMLKLSEYLELQYDYILDLNMLELPNVTRLRSMYREIPNVKMALQFHAELENSLKELAPHQDIAAVVLAERGEALHRTLTELLKRLTHGLLELDEICFFIRHHQLPSGGIEVSYARNDLLNLSFFVLSELLTLEEAWERAHRAMTLIQELSNDPIVAQALLSLEVLELSLMLEQPNTAKSE